MEIRKADSIPSREGPDDWFTGSVRVEMLFQAKAPSRLAGANVTFQPGARTVWHTHPLGQHLVVTSGTGWVQRQDGPVEVVRAGDVIWFPPGEKHWHGASASEAMSHLAMQEELDGEAVEWLEKVSDRDYGSGKEA